MSARIALLHILHMAAERGGAAVADCLESLSLMSPDYVAPFREVLFFVGAEDIGHFEPMLHHCLFGNGRTNKIDQVQTPSGHLRGANGAIGEVQIACRGSEEMLRGPAGSLDHPSRFTPSSNRWVAKA